MVLANLKTKIKITTMKKIFLTIALIATGICATAQVGINNTNPQASLDVAASPAGEPDGVLVPRVTVGNLNTKAATYVAAQNGALVFVTNITGAAGKTSEVTSTGFHYYNSGTSKWLPLAGAAAPARTVTNITTAPEYIVPLTDDIILWTGTAATNFTFAPGAPIGKTYVIINKSPNFQPLTLNTLNTGDTANCNPNSAIIVMHIGGEVYSNITGF